MRRLTPYQIGRAGGRWRNLSERYFSSLESRKAGKQVMSRETYERLEKRKQELYDTARKQHRQSEPTE
jgi:hypothetical protein